MECWREVLFFDPLSAKIQTILGIRIKNQENIPLFAPKNYIRAKNNKICVENQTGNDTTA